MQKFRMEKPDFQAWKEGNEWFWEYLRQTIEDHEGALDSIKADLVECPDSDVEELRRRSVVVQARIDVMEDMLDLTFEGLAATYTEWEEAA